jgi:hypothetical protein
MVPWNHDHFTLRIRARRYSKETEIPDPVPVLIPNFGSISYLIQVRNLQQ